jgi:hypothetical protein
MALASAEAKYEELHKVLAFHDGTFTNWSADRSSQTPFHYRDGVSLWVANIDLTPDDEFLSGRLADQSPDDDSDAPRATTKPEAPTRQLEPRRCHSLLEARPRRAAKASRRRSGPRAVDGTSSIPAA